MLSLNQPQSSPDSSSSVKLAGGEEGGKVILLIRKAITLAETLSLISQRKSGVVAGAYVCEVCCRSRQPCIDHLGSIAYPRV